MALFQKKQVITSAAPLYTVGMHKTILLVGLGNIGPEYKLTRHNLGFISIDSFAEAHEFDPWITKKGLKSLITQKVLGDTRVILCKPTTMMNLSGEAVGATANFYKIPTSDITAIYDEADILFGQIRTRIGGSAGGHNGVKSMIQHNGEDFGRVRIGIGHEKPTKMKTADYVLAKLSKNEQEQLNPLTKEVTSMLTEHIFSGNLPHETRKFIL